MHRICFPRFPVFALPVFGLLLLVLASGCAAGGSGTYVPPQQNLIAFDFSDYTEAGFTIMPEGYEGPYKSIGMISMTLRPEARKVGRRAEEVAARESAEEGSEYVARGEWVVRRVTTDQMVEAAYEEAEAMGANGIINFSVRGTARPVAADLSLPEYTVSGFAVLLFQE